VRPELMPERAQAEIPTRYRELVFYGFLICLGLAVFVAPFACGWPDGLEKVAARLGFEHRAATPAFASPLADYTVPGVHSIVLSTAVAGAAGTIVAFLLAYALARFLTPKAPSRT
jgi:hypothetical protein